MTETPAKLHGFAVLGAMCASLPAVLMWGFTVDDALISVRYAHNLVTGSGYRFDPHGPSTDGVTPLPWPFLLAPLAGGDLLATLVRAKVVGLTAWTLAGGALGARVGAMLRGQPRAQLALGAASLGVMGLAFPIGAWASSGMETGLALALATVAVTRFAMPKQLALFAGLSVALRPEMVVWAIVVSMGAAIVGEGRGASETSEKNAKGEERFVTNGASPPVVRFSGLSLVAVAFLATSPFAACALIRAVVFGRVAPLAVMAKPSDLSHGLAYAGAAALVVLTPLLTAAPVALVTERGVAMARVLVLAFGAHVLALVGAGGDWMPYARLMVPVAPSLVIAFVEISSKSRRLWSWARLGVAVVLGTLIARRAAPDGRRVFFDRADLVARARPALSGAKVVAALDIGWTSAATNARIVDLAGLTDPAIAMLPGGHTSKRVDTTMLLDRGVDTVVVYSSRRAVEARIVGSELFASRFEAVEMLPVGSRGAFYTIYRRRS